MPIFLSTDGLIQQAPVGPAALAWFDREGSLIGVPLVQALANAGWQTEGDDPTGAPPFPALGEPLRLRQTGPEPARASVTCHPCQDGLLAVLARETDEAQPSTHLHDWMALCPSVHYRQDLDLRFLWVGPGAESLFGAPENVLRETPDGFLLHLLEDDLRAYRQLCQQTHCPGSIERLDLRIRHGRNGQVRYLRDERRLKADPATGILFWEGVLWDVSRQTIAEKHLRRTAWKEHLATLTSGLVHDFSNVMAGIYGLADLYHQDLDEKHPFHKGLGQIRKSSAEARKLVRRIVDLNREQETTPNYHNLEHLIQEQLDLAPAILPKGTRIETDFTGQEIPVYLDAVTFRQVFLNFLINSRDALDAKGEIRVSVRPISSESGILEGCYGCGGLRAERDGVQIEVADNGCGIPESHLARIFDPYFTTKDTTQGSGFGLYNARLFAEENHGHLGVRSQPGNGCTMVLFLPLATFHELDEAPQADPQIEPAANGDTRHRVLVFTANKRRECNLVDLMHARQWEVLTLSRPQALRDHLSDERQPPPDLVALIDLEQDVHASALTEMVRNRFPEVPVALRVFGRNPDELATQLRQSVTAVFDESLHDAEVVKKMSSLFLNVR
ncbi:MAG: nitrogen regulation protein NR(II) [Opitutales bacterium]